MDIRSVQMTDFDNVVSFYKYVIEKYAENTGWTDFLFFEYTL